MVFMTIGIALFGVLSGHLSASFVESRSSVKVISEISQLSGLRVAGYPYVLDSMIKGAIFDKVYCTTMSDCGAKLASGEIDALVYDEPVMMFWRDSDPWAKQNTLVIGRAIDAPPVGIAFPEGGLPGSNHTAINAALIDFITTSSYRELRAKWFPERVATAGSGDEPIEWPLVSITLVCVVVYVSMQVALQIRKSGGKIDVKGAAGKSLKRMSTVSSSDFMKAVAGKAAAPVGPSPPEQTEVEIFRSNDSESRLAARLEAKLDRLMGTEAKLDKLLEMREGAKVTSVL